VYFFLDKAIYFVVDIEDFGVLSPMYDPFSKKCCCVAYIFVWPLRSISAWSMVMLSCLFFAWWRMLKLKAGCGAGGGQHPIPQVKVERCENNNTQDLSHELAKKLQLESKNKYIRNIS
jgi:hypothetical protein